MTIEKIAVADRTDDRPIEDVLRDLMAGAHRGPHTVKTDGTEYGVTEQVKWLASELGYHIGYRMDGDRRLHFDVIADDRNPGIFRKIRNEWALRALDLAGLPEEDVDQVRAGLGLPPRDREWDASCNEHDERNNRVHEEWGRMVPLIYKSEVSAPVRATLDSLLRVRQAAAGSGSWAGGWTVDLEAARVVQAYDPAHPMLDTVLGPVEVRETEHGAEVELTGLLTCLELHGTPEHPWCTGGLFLPSGKSLNIEIVPEVYAEAPKLVDGGRFTLTGKLRKKGTPPKLNVATVATAAV